MKRITLINEVSQLILLNDFIDEAAEEWGWTQEWTMSLNLVLEEAVSNVIFYAYSGEFGHSLEICLREDNGMVEVVITDSGKAFDPTSGQVPDLTLPAEMREIGGLGIYLMSRIMDEVFYRRIAGQNILTMRKKR